MNNDTDAITRNDIHDFLNSPDAKLAVAIAQHFNLPYAGNIVFDEELMVIIASYREQMDGLVQDIYNLVWGSTAAFEGDIATLILDRNEFDKLGRRLEAMLASIKESTHE